MPFDGVVVISRLYIIYRKLLQNVNLYKIIKQIQYVFLDSKQFFLIVCATR